MVSKPSRFSTDDDTTTSHTVYVSENEYWAIGRLNGAILHLSPRDKSWLMPVNSQIGPVNNV